MDEAQLLGVRGHLQLRVEEASGKTPKEQLTWDTTPVAGMPFEAFVKVELRGGVRNLKAQTRKQPLVGDTVTWQEDLRLDVLDGSKELRLMLCREKYNNGKKGTAVIAACGIFVDDILDAVPIDKYFELFKPNAGGEGGYIRISMNYKTVADMIANRGGPTVAPHLTANTGEKQAGTGGKKGSALGGFLKFVVTLGLVGAAAGGITKLVQNRRKNRRS